MSINNPTLDELLSSPIGSKWSPATASRTSYTQEIQQMMYSFGDYERPLYESAQLIEQIVHQQMTSVLLQAVPIAESRGSRLIGLEEILFLMRGDRNKLSRFVKHLSVKDGKNTFISTGIVDVDDIIDNNNINNINDNNTTSNLNQLVSTDDMPAKPPQQTKRVKYCYDFLKSIDNTGTLLSIFDNNFVDSVQHERNLRSNKLTDCMTTEEYLNYSESRQTGFANKSRPSKFRDWLLKDYFIDMKPNPLALEVLQYLAKETVSQIVDLSLLVKQDLERDVCDPMASLLPQKMINKDFPPNHLNSCPNSNESEDLLTNLSSNTPFFMTNSQSVSSCKSTISGGSDGGPKSKKRKRADPSKVSFEAHSYCITPNHIREAIRRYFTNSGPFTKTHHSTNQTMNYQKKLLCL